MCFVSYKREEFVVLIDSRDLVPTEPLNEPNSDRIERAIRQAGAIEVWILHLVGQGR